MILQNFGLKLSILALLNRSSSISIFPCKISHFVGAFSRQYAIYSAEPQRVVIFNSSEMAGYVTFTYLPNIK
jgi:hypothetical protein